MEQTLGQRFAGKVSAKPDIRGCLLWQGAIQPASDGSEGGYGHIRVRLGDRWVVRRAHRVAWELVLGEIPKGAVVSPTCGNKLCVNVEHLRLRWTGHSPGKPRVWSDQARNMVLKARNEHGYSWKMIEDELGVPIRTARDMVGNKK